MRIKLRLPNGTEEERGVESTSEILLWNIWQSLAQKQEQKIETAEMPKEMPKEMPREMPKIKKGRRE